MKSLTELIVRVADLAEAEGRVLRLVTVRLATSAIMFVIAGAVMLSGLAFLLWSLFAGLEARVGTVGAAATSGAIALITGGAIAWLGRRLAKG